MITRRSLMAGTAALAAGCSSLESSFSPPSLPKKVELTWGVLPFGDIFVRGEEASDYETRVMEIAAALKDDTDNPNGPVKGRYALSPKLIDIFDRDPQPKDLEEELAWFSGLEVDLIVVGPFLAQMLGERGVILPLDPLIAADEPGLEEKFFPFLLDHLRSEEGLFALPVGAQPIMLHYVPEYFEDQGVSPVDEHWDWDDLKESAIELTQRDEEGELQRWGLVLRSYGYWWALWQNEADVADAGTLRCLLQDPAAAEALQFCHDLLHKHRVAPLITHWEPYSRFNFPGGKGPGMLVAPYAFSWDSEYRFAVLPKGKVRSVPVMGDMGIAIMARTENTNAAFTALKGLIGTLQRYVPVPAQKEAVARLGDYHKVLLPDEIAAIQQSMASGRGIPLDRNVGRAMHALVEGIVRGDDVVSVVNEACSLLEV